MGVCHGEESRVMHEAGMIQWRVENRFWWAVFKCLLWHRGLVLSPLWVSVQDIGDRKVTCRRQLGYLAVTVAEDERVGAAARGGSPEG